MGARSEIREFVLDYLLSRKPEKIVKQRSDVVRPGDRRISPAALLWTVFTFERRYCGQLAKREIH